MLGLDLGTIGYPLAVVLGVGFLIFIHELGHFLAARAAGVRVEQFAIGFGPRLFGWQRGETEYRLGLIPIGGYVKMAGELPGEGGQDDPGNLQSKSVGWRFLIYSGGVLMNGLFAFVAFPILFYVGIPFTAPEIGAVSPGSPAWHAGLERGDTVLAVDGREAYSYEFLRVEAALSGEDGMKLLVRSPGQEPREVHVAPRYMEDTGIKELGVGPPMVHKFELEVREGGPAWQAGLRTGDQLLGIQGEKRDLVRGLGLFERSLAEADRWLDEEEPRLLALDVKQVDGTEKHVELRAASREDDRARLLGVSPLPNRVVARRSVDPETDAALAAMDLPDEVAIGFVETPTDGKVERRPIREAEDLRRLLPGSPDGTRLGYERPGPAGGWGLCEVPARFRTEDGAASLVDALAFGINPAPQVEVIPLSAAAEAGLRSGDLVTSIDGHEITTYEALREAARAADGAPLVVAWTPLQPDHSFGPERKATITPRYRVVPDFGLDFPATVQRQVFQSKNLVDSLVSGTRMSFDKLRELYVTLKRILGGSVSSKNIGGPISIFVVSQRTVESGLVTFLFFLAFLSLNLGFINVLPIPVLDGGHLLFLLVEKIKGSPVSESVQTYAQYLGVALILSLLIYVTYNDILRHLGG
ncbi:MAG: RIP metalloprotease RseP [Planctomycetota bacterium]